MAETITKTQRIAEIAKRANTSEETTRAVLKAIREIVLEDAGYGLKVTIPGLCTVETREHPCMRATADNKRVADSVFKFVMTPLSSLEGEIERRMSDARISETEAETLKRAGISVVTPATLS